MRKHIFFYCSCDEITLNNTEFSGKVVLCKSGSQTDITQAQQIIENGGGLGLIFSQHTILSLEGLKGNFPCIAVDGVVLQEIIDYRASIG